MDKEEDSKWKFVLSKSNEVLYYYNTATGQQRWANQTCFCSKAKSGNLNKSLSPCCIKDTSIAKEKGVAKQQNFHDSHSDTSSEVYCLSDIIKEIRTSLLCKRRRRRRSLKLRPKHGSKNLKGPQYIPKSVAKTTVNANRVPKATTAVNSIPKATGANILPAATTVASKYVSMVTPVVAIVPIATQRKDTDKPNNADKIIQNSLKRKQDASVVNGYKLRPRTGFMSGRYCGKKYKRQKLKVSGNKSCRSEIVVESKSMGMKGIGKEPGMNGEVAEQDGPQSRLRFQNTTTGIKGTPEEIGRNVEAAEHERPQLRLRSKTTQNPRPAKKTTLTSSDSEANVIVSTSTAPPIASVVSSKHVPPVKKSRKHWPSESVPATEPPIASVVSSKHVPPVKKSRKHWDSENVPSTSMTSDVGKSTGDVASRGLPPSVPGLQDSQYKSDNVEKRVQEASVQEANIKFVADETLSIGGKVQKFQQVAEPLPNQVKNPNKLEAFVRLESIADSLKETSRNTVKGSSSAWIKITTELDVLKNNRTAQVHREVVSCPDPESKNLPKPSCNEPEASVRNNCSSTNAPACNPSNSPVVEKRIQPCSPNNNVGVKEPSVSDVVMRSNITHRRLKPYAVTEVHASYVDLSWRIVTSNGLHSSSLKNFYKLVPVRENRATTANSENDDFSFLGVPVHGDGQVIAKILNTTVPEENEEVFVFERPPTISRTDHKGRITLSFVWDRQAVEIMPKDMSNSKKTTLNLLNPPMREHTISLQLPKPLQLPQASCKIFLGDFYVQTITGEVEFNVSHVVTVSTSPRTSLTIPPGALAKSKANVCQTSRCRVQGVTRDDVENSKNVPIEIPTTSKKRLSKPCSFCGVALHCIKDVRRHRRIHTSVGGVKCSECARRLRTGGRLSVHIDSHKCHLKVKCQKCKKIFKAPKLLSTDALAKYYLKRCIACRKAYKCKKCSVYFVSLEGLHDHTLKTHYLKCGICEETFLYKRDLNKHMTKQHKIATSPPSACISRLSR